MKSVAVAALAGAASAATHPSFAEYAVRYGKVYATVEEWKLREAIYAKNLAAIEAHNAKGLSWTLGVNKFADLDNAEWAARYTGGKKMSTAAERAAYPVYHAPLSAPAPPNTFSWLNAKPAVVNPAQNQGDCGSCYAFSVTAVVESAVAIKTGTLYKLAEQEIVDCSSECGNEGCNGGDQLPTFNWLPTVGGMASEVDYPYTGEDGSCRLGGSVKPVPATNITGGAGLPANNDTALIAALMSTPVSISVEADSLSWQLYFGGVVNDPNCGTNLDHAVVLTGYGASNGQAYYEIRNSWGADWGVENGYIWLARVPGDDKDPGMCGVLMDNSVAIV